MPSFPPDVKVLHGVYSQSMGFEVWKLTLNPNDSAVLAWSPDHAGGKSWNGTWSFKDSVVKVRVATEEGGRINVHEYVPVKWGDWNLLVPRSQIVDFAVEEKAFARRVSPEDWNPRYYARSKKPNHQAKRHGLPAAPAKFQQLFQNIEIGG